MNLIEVLNLGYKILKQKNIASYKIDAEILLGDILKISKEKMMLNLEKKIHNENLNKYIYLINRRKKNEPVAYLLNRKEFWKNEFYVNKDVLIPRPETEHLVEAALKFTNKREKKRYWK